jgi:hypothetical protein
LKNKNVSKKILSVLVLTSFLGLLVVPMMVEAQQEPIKGCTMRNEVSGTGIKCPPPKGDCLFGSDEFTCGICCLLDTVYTLTNWVFIVIVALAMLFIFMGAYNIVTAAGDAEKVTSGRNYILYAVVGFIVALLARAIPDIAKNILGTYS